MSERPSDVCEFDFDEWMKTMGIFDDKTGITYANHEEMHAAWGWRRRIREEVADFWEYRIVRPLRNLKYWFLYRFHPKHRYNVVRTGLPNGYYDVVTLMPVVIVKLFRDYIEIEKPFEHFDTEDSFNKVQWDAIKRLYGYFKDVDPTDPPHEKLRYPIRGTDGDRKAYDLVYKVRRDRFIKNLCEVVFLYEHYWT